MILLDMLKLLYKKKQKKQTQTAESEGKLFFKDSADLIWNINHTNCTDVSTPTRCFRG